MRTFGILTSFVSSPETEKERLLYSCANVASGFYTQHGWLILPRPAKGYEKFCEVIPEIVKVFSSDFWKDAASGGGLMPKILSERMWKEAKDIYIKEVDKKIVEKFEKGWQNIEHEAWFAISSMFPIEHKWIKSLEVRITNIGSLGSHYLLTNNKNHHLIINLRTDAKPKDILNLLILALIYPLADDLGLSFTQRQTVRNFIITRPVFKKIYPDFLSSTFDKPKIPIGLINQSNDYIKFLKIPNIIDPITEINKNLNIFGVKESKIITELVNKNGEIITYDDIADLILGQGRFKSYWAINKLIQRVQKKINSLDIVLKIQGIRGRGYILNGS